MVSQICFFLHPFHSVISIGFQRIDIVLTYPQKIYYSGHQISGNVHLDLDQPTSALGIRLKCKGETQVYFTDRSAGIRRKFSAFENYLHVETYLVGDGKEKSVITGGVYPFSLTLPENLPCSFEGRYGRVRYSIRALLDVTTIYRFSTNIIPFTVAPILDLNRDPLAPVSRKLTTNGDIAFALPISVKQSKMYIGQTEPLSMSMELPVHGYVPGQTIPIKIVMTNPTTVVVTKIRVVCKKVTQLFLQLFLTCLSTQVYLPGHVTLATIAKLTRMFLPTVPLYEKSQIYRSSKPDKDDPTGDDGDSDGEVKPYSPMYRVYTFTKSSQTEDH
ncbi:hypothetical protein E2986_03404 [Frieseomelitta varia]|uniref:Arrestin-like N-terminal domain-containing protein n=1 Tax=Frieseomelitta varia TaxID=561572 RepID=A0A833SBA1_9HYME|nr:hypothetical protein E2986_03404 [Frieseomelitta varia]